MYWQNVWNVAKIFPFYINFREIWNIVEIPQSNFRMFSQKFVVRNQNAIFSLEKDADFQSIFQMFLGNQVWEFRSVSTVH